MSYLKKEYRVLINKIDKELKMPKGWYYFVKKEQAKQNFIIKSKGICNCHNCGTNFKSSKTINEYEKCPKCHNIYLIKQSNYSWHLFENVLILVDEIDDKWVIRLFEIFTKYTPKSIYHSKPAEYGRIIISKNKDKNIIELANDRAYNSLWGSIRIDHTREGKKWRLFNKFYRSFSASGKVYDKNLKELFKNTEFKYSQLWDVAKNNDELDIRYHLVNNFPSTEFLAKMQLYKLAADAGAFNKGKSFKDRFGIEKEYYQFMKKNNIDYRQLSILKIYKVQNIDNINFLNKFDPIDIEKLQKIVNLDNFIEYAKGIKHFDIKMYIDYIYFLKELRIDLTNKRYLFPENLKAKHDEYSKQILIKNNKQVDKQIHRRYRQLKKNSFSDKKYMLVPAKSFESLEDESEQLNHCVRSYAKKYAKGSCDIYFMRENKTPKKSLITIEVIDGKISQSRTKGNGIPNSNQSKFIKKWERRVLEVA